MITSILDGSLVNKTSFMYDRTFNIVGGGVRGRVLNPTTHYVMVFFTNYLFHLFDINEYKSNSVCENSYCSVKKAN